MIRNNPTPVPRLRRNSISSAVLQVCPRSARPKSSTRKSWKRHVNANAGQRQQPMSKKRQKQQRVEGKGGQKGSSDGSR